MTFHRRNCQRGSIVEHVGCGARRCACLRNSLPQLGRSDCPLRRGRALRHLASLTGVRRLPRLRRSTFSGQLSVPFLIGQQPRRYDAVSGHQSETFHHFC